MSKLILDLTREDESNIERFIELWSAYTATVDIGFDDSPLEKEIEDKALEVALLVASRYGGIIR